MQNKFLKRSGLVFVGLVILSHWLVAIVAIKKGHMFAFQNYFGAPQESYTLIFSLLVITPLYIAYMWKHWR